MKWLVSLGGEGGLVSGGGNENVSALGCLSHILFTSLLLFSMTKGDGM